MSFKCFIPRLTLGLTTGRKLSYQPGDSISISASNSDEDVSWLLGRLNGSFLPDQHIILKHSPTLRRPPVNGPPTDTPLTARMVVKQYLELHAIASRKTVKLLADTCVSTEDSSNAEEQKKTLLFLSGREGMKLYDR